MKVATWIRYWSSVVDACSVVLVAPLPSRPSATIRSASKPSPLTNGGIRWVIVLVPWNETELLNTLFAGFAASVRNCPLSASRSPALPRSPSYATTPTELRTGPLIGVLKPLTPIDSGGSPCWIVAEPVEHREVAQRQGRVAVDDDQRPAGVAVLAGPALHVGDLVPAGAAGADERGDVGERDVRRRDRRCWGCRRPRRLTGHVRGAAPGCGAGPCRARRRVRRWRRRRRAPALVRPPQYSPANSTSVPAGGVNVELDELNVAGSASVSTGTIAKLLLLSAAPVAVPACDAAQFGAAAGHVISVLPVTQIAPGSFVLKRGTNGCSTTAEAVAGAIAAASRSSVTHLTVRRMAPEANRPADSASELARSRSPRKRQGGCGRLRFPAPRSPPRSDRA